MTGSPEPVAAVRTAKQFLTYVASGPFQYAGEDVLPEAATRLRKAFTP